MRGALLVLGLTACAPVVWERPGATEREFFADEAQCQHQAAAVPVMRRDQVYAYCMRGKGWREAE